MLETAPDPELSSEQRIRVDALTSQDVKVIDEALLASSSQTWRKVAFVVGSAMQLLAGRYASIPDVYFSQRVRALVSLGKLSSQGNLLYMRFAEVRRPVS